MCPRIEEEIFTKWQTELGERKAGIPSFGTTTISHSCIHLGMMGTSKCQICQALAILLHLMKELHISIKGRNQDDQLSI